MKAGAVTTAGRGPEQGHEGGPLRCEFLQSLLLRRENLFAKIHTTPTFHFQRFWGENGMQRRLC